MTLSGLGNRDKPSASWFCEPGRCIIMKLYPCNWINIHCTLGGADAMGLLAIITRGQWSVMLLNSHPYKYVWNHCIPNTFKLDTGESLFSGCTILASIRDGSELAVCVWLQECSSIQYLSSLHRTARLRGSK